MRSSNEPEAAVAELSDDELMRRYAASDTAAFDLLYRRHKDAVYRYFLRQLEPAAAADALQDTWLRIVGARASYRPTGRFTAYLFKIAHNVVMDHFRRTMKSEPIGVEDAPGADDDGQADVQADVRAATERLHVLIRQLPVTQRNALIMQKESGLSLREIAEITGASEEAVKSRLRYAMTKLRHGMRHHAHVI